ncbi:MAG TPA: glycosyltransferase family 39 protein [Chthoniobacterales bacterium]
MLTLRLLNIFRYRFDTDESQHMHVLWGWTHNLVQYRDIFDNHMPLFQIAFAPLLGLAGERAETLFVMRLAMLPLYFLAAWATYRIGEILFSRRVGLWAAILTGCYHLYFFSSLEFRTDNLWAPLALLAILTLIEGEFSLRQAFTAGLVLGFCFAISAKTLLLLFVILLSGVCARFLSARPPKLTRYTLAWLAAILIVPVVIMLWFAAAGAWSQFYYCVFQHNILPGVDRTNDPETWMVLFPLSFPLLLYAGWRIVRGVSDSELGFRRCFVFLIAAFYFAGLYSFWTLLTRQDMLPFFPLCFVFVAAAVFALPDRVLRSLPQAWLVVFELLTVIVTRPLEANGAGREYNLIADTLRLTTPADPVFDLKGETVFRRRCVYHVFEPLTLVRIHRRLITEPFAERCISSHTCVIAIEDGHLTGELRDWLQTRYLPVTRDLRVAGSFLAGNGAGRPIVFQITIPAEYEIISPRGAVDGLLDGEPLKKRRFLTAGEHRFVPDTNGNALAVLWARAVEKGFDPFRLRNFEVRKG